MSTDQLLALVSQLEDSVSLPGDVVQTIAGGRVDESHWVGRATGPIANPEEWLLRFDIPIVKVPQHQMGEASALFQHMGRGAEFIRAEVQIPIGSDINAEDVRWSVWHEIGHASDYVGVREDKAIYTPQGHYSTKHIEVLRRHQETIIKWTPHPDRNYKTRPKELWAEVVACCLCQPPKVPEELWQAVRPDLVALYLPVAKDQGMFGPVIYAYTRADAIADGVLVDLSQDPKSQGVFTEAGFRWPVALTSSVFAEIEELSGGDGQDITGQLRVLVAALKEAAVAAVMKNPGEDTVFFNFENSELIAKSHPGDRGEPVMTIMRPGED